MESLSFLGSSPRGFHRLHATLFKASGDAPPIVCVHGLARNGRDFDDLGAALSSGPNGRTVVCPDVVGRGQSDWLDDPSLYVMNQYVADTTALLARIGALTVDWVGSSMGGLLGMILAAMPRSPIRRLVLNDVGAVVPSAPLTRISGYMSAKQPSFATRRDFELYLRTIYAGFGRLTDAQWARMAETSSRRDDDGSYRPTYDPAIWNPAQPVDQDVDLWEVYDRVTQPVLLIRGANSDILPPALAQAMTQRGPKAKLVTIPDTAHPPALMCDEQIALVASFLNG
jgi:pimeloyl-ACP methyl ester carboxylesterase